MEEVEEDVEEWKSTEVCAEGRDVEQLGEKEVVLSWHDVRKNDEAAAEVYS